MQKKVENPKQKMLRTFLTYSVLFAGVKLILDRGNPNGGWDNLLLTSAVFGGIMAAFTYFRESRKKTK